MQRWSAFCSSPNILGALSAVLVAAAIAALITASSATRCRHRSLLLIWGWSGATIGAVVLFGSASKGAVIAAMAGMAAVLFVAGSARESNLRHIPIKVAFGGVVVAMVLCLWMAPRFMGAVGGDISTVQRWHTWTVSLAVIGDHPFLASVAAHKR